MMRVRTSLDRAPSGATAEQLEAYGTAYERELWQRHGVVILRPERIANDWLRRAIVNEAERLHGKRA